MNTEPQTSTVIKYDLDVKNHAEIQGLILRSAAEFRRMNGVGKGRAQIMAEDYVAANHITGAISGQQLSSWLGNVHNGFRRVVQAKVADPVQEIEMPLVPTPLQDSDTFNLRLTGKNKVVDPVLMQLMEKCRQIKPQQVWSFPVASEDEARALQGYMPKVAKMLGWRDGKKSHSYLFQIYPDRLKIKRLI